MIAKDYPDLTPAERNILIEKGVLDGKNGRPSAKLPSSTLASIADARLRGLSSGLAVIPEEEREFKKKLKKKFPGLSNQ